MPVFPEGTGGGDTIFVGCVPRVLLGFPPDTLLVGGLVVTKTQEVFRTGRFTVGALRVGIGRQWHPLCVGRVAEVFPEPAPLLCASRILL